MPGEDLTIISYGTTLYTCAAAIEAIKRETASKSVSPSTPKSRTPSIELIDLRTIYPWDRETIFASARKTGRVIIVHESMVNAGVGAEIAASIQKECFLKLEAPVERVGGWSTHTGLVFEKFVVPDVCRKFYVLRLFGDSGRGACGC